MINWLKNLLGIDTLSELIEYDNQRISALEKLAEGGTYENYIKTKTTRKPQRYDEIERNRSRRKKDHSLHGGYVPHD